MHYSRRDLKGRGRSLGGLLRFSLAEGILAIFAGKPLIIATPLLEIK
jgi:hypothetical protein